MNYIGKNISPSRRFLRPNSCAAEKCRGRKKEKPFGYEGL
jgi:hypothetical protein